MTTFTIYLINWFNYGQRKIDRYDTINEYIDKVVYSKTVNNFFINDGVNTQLDLNTSIEAPYLIVTDEENNIESRWYVMHREKLRGGQFAYFLRRDLIADFLDEFLASTVYVEKGYINNTQNVLIYNQEQFQSNKIKQKEIPLSDPLGLKWIVGYLNKNSLGYTYNENGEVVQSTKEYQSYLNKAYTPDIIVNGLSNWQYYDFINGAKRYAATVTANFDYQYGGVLDVKE